MNIEFKKLVAVSGVLLSAAVFSSAGVAEPSLSSGGYAHELSKMEMMKMVDANNDHMVTAAEFTDYYGNLFSALDKDGNGDLSAKEWVGVKGQAKVDLATGGYSVALRTLNTMNKMDADGDHKVTKDEFISYHQAIFNAKDKSGDGQLDPQEWLAKHIG